MKNKQERAKIKRNNAQLFPIYKMFSWDVICFYSIEFLFYTITKGVTASQVLIINACFIISRIIMQIPAVAITDISGKRNSIIIGNILSSIYLIVLIFAPGLLGVIIADIICALGYDIKSIAETNLLYDSVSTRGGEGLYSKLDSMGGSWYYMLDGITCLSAGYLFVINNYLPIIICLGFTIISTILSFRFKDVYHKKIEYENMNMATVLREYSIDLRESCKFIIKSKRMKAYILFGAVFYGFVRVIEPYQSTLLIARGVPEEQFSMIFAIITLLAGISVTLSRKLHKKYRNRTLTVISLTHVSACLVVATFANIFKGSAIIPLAITMFAVIKMCSATWNILKHKYLKNFSTQEIRNKITFTFELITGIIASIMSLIGSIILKKCGVNYAFLIVSLLALGSIVLILDYMRPRFGLKPKEYKKEDIDMSELIKQ